MSYLSQSNWSSGQLSKNALGQVGSSFYQGGARVLNDAVIGKYATVRKRSGTKYIASTASGAEARLIPFKVQGQGDFICEFTGGTYTGFMNPGVPGTNSLQVWDTETELVVNTYQSPYSSTEQFEIQYSQSEDSLYLVHESHAPYVLSLMEGVWSWGEIDYSTAPQADSGSQGVTFTTDNLAPLTTTQPRARLQCSEDHFESNDVGNIYRVVDRWFSIEAVESAQSATAKMLYLNPNIGQQADLEYSTPTSDWDGPWVLDTTFLGPRIQNITATGIALHAQETIQINVEDGTTPLFGTGATSLQGQPGRLINVDPGEADSNAGERLMYVRQVLSPVSADAVAINTLDSNTFSSPVGCTIYNYQSRTVTNGTVYQLSQVIGTPSNPGTVYTSTAQFNASDLGTVQIFGGEIEITSVISPYEARFIILAALSAHDPAINLAQLQHAHPTMLVGAAISADTGFPRAVTFHGDRLFFAGFAKYPNRVLSSKVSDHLNWGQSANDDAGLSFDITSTTTNRVAWMLSSGRSMLLGTGSGEYVVAGTPMTPTNLSVQLQSSLGSRPVQPVHVDRAPTYTSRCGCTARSMTFDYRSERHVSTDITILIDDQFDTALIRELAYIVEPDTLVAMVLNDGSVKAMSQRDDSGVAGWSNWSMKASSVCSMPAENGDELWFSVLRDGKYSLEKWSSDSGVYTDGWYKWVGVSILTGATHLAGKTVQVVTDGAYTGDQTVGTDGLLSLLDAPVTAAYIGIGYTFEVQPLFTEFSDNEGHTPGRVKNVTNVYVQLSSPVSGTVNGFDLSPEDTTGDDWYIVPSTGVYGPIPLVSIEQSKPLEMHVLSVTADLTVKSTAGDGI